RPGDAVRLPGAAGPSKTAGIAIPQRHVVRRGETLAAIGRKYGVAPGDLKAWNGLKGDRIQAGQRLRLTPR
ncbi:MAG TPA: LysM peptidoglycan-binding domain-containing protein, partial [Geothrix sp.]|nr:LysM peptidoglycan-binding domain-containing protein [Geothrix sp.]